eukprot:gnl/TRDRNA2_/TRDRNA2_138265_c0_seq3.p1 gnl/TRDRNA2_/TRDRNA2_138265_c0~~gnl/TRDRNA2_/TRDRNA2_138265_c0_seq3.p1  ORF type:complete len:243 (+),score=25.14 gnl/TRDRNA2_/TRDRNA2_138265_c0_seq3:119-847(+)
MVWQLSNGDVQLTDPLASFSSMKLQHPQLLGSGGGGAVFSFERSGEEVSKGQVAVKVSWLPSTTSVESECKILQVMEERQVRGVEKCLDMERYPADTRRVMIALEPVVDDSISSIDGVDEGLQAHAVISVVRTMVDMLAANVATVDVQPLISRQTGDVLFIDMTAARAISQPPSFLDRALVSSFCSEMLSLIPESLNEVASEALREELQASEDRKAVIQDEILNVLRSQALVMPPEMLTMKI